MKKAAGIKVVVGRFGSEPENLTLPKDATVGDLLQEKGITLSNGENIWVNGEKATSRDILENGDVVNVVASKQGGC